MSHEASDDFAPDRDRCRDIAPFVHGHPAAREMVITAVKRACEQVGFC
jgi:hypothetical protein